MLFIGRVGPRLEVLEHPFAGNFRNPDFHYPGVRGRRVLREQSPGSSGDYQPGQIQGAEDVRGEMGPIQPHQNPGETLPICVFMLLELEMQKEQRILMDQLPPVVASSRRRRL